MNFKELVSKVAKLEGKKHQSPVGDVREIIKIVLDLAASDPKILLFIMKEIVKRSKN